MEINKKFRYKRAIGDFCLQITILGKPELVKKIDECISKETQKEEWRHVEEI